jgi:hypothetical protein
MFAIFVDENPKEEHEESLVSRKIKENMPPTKKPLNLLKIETNKKIFV